MASGITYTANHHYRSKFMRYLLVITICVAFVSSAYHFYLHEYFVGVVKMVLTLGAAILLYALPRVPLYQSTAAALILIYGTIFLSMLGAPSIGIWMLTLPSLSFTVVKREYVPYVDATGFVLIVLAYALVNHFGLAVFSPDMFFNLVVAYVVLAYVSYLFQKLIIQYRSDLAEALAEKRKQQASRTLSSGIAHLINNQMTSIIGNASLLEGVQGQDKAFVDSINHSAFQTSKYANDLLAYAEQSVMNHDEYIDLEECLQESIDHVTDQGDVSISLDVSDDMPLVVGNRQQLTSAVFENVLMNAIEANPKTGIQVRVYQEHISKHAGLFPGDYARIDVVDDGEGVPPAVLKQVFDPFYTTKFLGRGLGLAAAFGAVKRHQGLIELQSTPGKQTVCSIWLPIKLEAIEMVDDDEVWEL